MPKFASYTPDPNLPEKLHEDYGLMIKNDEMNIDEVFFRLNKNRWAVVYAVEDLYNDRHFIGLPDHDRLYQLNNPFPIQRMKQSYVKSGRMYRLPNVLHAATDLACTARKLELVHKLDPRKVVGKIQEHYADIDRQKHPEFKSHIRGYHSRPPRYDEKKRMPTHPFTPQEQYDLEREIRLGQKPNPIGIVELFVHDKEIPNLEDLTKHWIAAQQP
ncbi:hypothetical protein [Endozoicomonas ascidiicola]|uniref:hypothetical protein n=1 Tax=Endozoicomonas ascidiicola TaxID=1698521 RepID=UPI0008320BEB|nr:hypothetical protein [Endozoicomonas ascidiicola]